MLIEARDRVGGRIYTVPATLGDLPVELGAEFVHGLPPELIHLIEEAGLTRFELEGENLCFRKDGGVGRAGTLRRPARGATSSLNELAHLEPPQEDLSFSEFVAQRGLSPEAQPGRPTMSKASTRRTRTASASARSSRQQAAEDAISGDRLFRVEEGYARVPEFLLRGFWRQADDGWPPPGANHRPGSRERWRWLPGPVRSSRRRPQSSPYPWGSCRRRRIAFVPQPVEILAAADRLVMGTAARVVYEFDRGFWSQFSKLRGVSFLFAPDVIPPTWWTTDPWPDSTLTGWLAGRRADQLNLAELPETGLATLAGLLGSDLLKYASTWCAGITMTGRTMCTAWEATPMCREGRSMLPTIFQCRWRRRSSSPANTPTRVGIGERFMEPCGLGIAPRNR